MLDWRPLWTEIKAHVIPVEIGLVQNITRRKSLRTLIKLTYHAYSFFDPNELEPMFKELLPYVRFYLSTSTCFVGWGTNC